MGFNTRSMAQDDTMADINVTPLVDVMLVLLIIFMITVPVITQSINVELPKASLEKTDSLQSTVAFELKPDGTYWWDHRPFYYRPIFIRAWFNRVYCPLWYSRIKWSSNGECLQPKYQGRHGKIQGRI